MSIEVINRVLNHSRTTGTARLTLVVLAEHADSDGYCYPGMELIASRVNIEERQQRRLIATLRASGELYATEHHGRRKTNDYLICTGWSEGQIARGLVAKMGVEETDAVDMAREMVKKQKQTAGELREKPVTSDMFTNEATRNKTCHPGQKPVISDQENLSDMTAKPVIRDRDIRTVSKPTARTVIEPSGEGANVAPLPLAPLPVKTSGKQKQPDSVTATDVPPSPVAPTPPPAKRKKAEGDTATPREPKHPAVVAYQQWVRREYKEPLLFCTATQTAMIASTVTDMGRWERTLAHWARNGWKSNSVEKMLDAYAKDAGAMARASPGGDSGRGEYSRAAKQPQYSDEDIERIKQMAQAAKEAKKPREGTNTKAVASH